ncbi:MAG TPA: nicotinamide mononucleotide transporter [Candidatus Avipropionibacterium avicola]|uniref:Nicotinamide mononucleotide transporter n=1 Tax=Candidatus Avipropionibacterium avicola TaxID=2840701 RepID=A0A9D1GWF9_9ACTN|nr:nicotinamide mononucleotide transporter [Candidatus Avipropionibacterium avicola]
MSELLNGLLNAELHLGFGQPILWREIIGNVFGLASAWLGMVRRVWAWPVGIIGNVLLFTVFTGVIFGNPQDLTLWGQAGRQVFFVAVSVYGWVQWWRYRNSHGGKEAVAPRWASWRERGVLVGCYLGLWVVLYFVLAALGSWGPTVDAWILAGSIMATYGMARGYVEFWLIWIAVDLVGVPTLVIAGFYPSAMMYAFYGFFCLIGFVQWWRVSRRDAATTAAGAADEAEVGAGEPVG